MFKKLRLPAAPMTPFRVFVGIISALAALSIIAALTISDHHGPPATSADQPVEVHQPTAAELAAAQAATEAKMFAEEQRFIRLVESFIPRYKGAPNEFVQSDMRSERKTALADFVPDLTAVYWVGTIDSMSTDSDGDGILDVRLSESIRLEAAPALLGVSALIPHGSRVYAEVSGLAVGNRVMFSGNFIRDDRDYLRELSFTEKGAMTDPEFLFKFEDIRRIMDQPQNPAAVVKPEPQRSGEQQERPSAMPISPATQPSSVPVENKIPASESTSAPAISDDERNRLTAQRRYDMDLITATEGMLSGLGLSYRAEVYCQFTVNQTELLVGSDPSKELRDFTHKANVDRCKGMILSGIQPLPSQDFFREKAAKAQQDLYDIEKKLGPIAHTSPAAASASVAILQPDYATSSPSVPKDPNAPDVPAVVLTKVQPAYTDEAWRAGFRGDIYVSVVIDDQGGVGSAKVVNSPGLGLDEKVAAAVRQWKFKPAMKNGAAVTSSATVMVTFRQ